MLFYRYIGKARYEGDEDHSYLVGADIILQEYESVKETPKGRWIARKGYGSYSFEKKHFVLNNSRRKFAYADKDEAWVSFRLRSEGRITHLERQLKASKMIIAEIKMRVQPTYKRME